MESLKEILDAIGRVPLWVWPLIPLIPFGASLAYRGIKTIYKAINAEDSQEDYSDKGIQQRIKESGGVILEDDDEDYNYNEDDEYYKLRSISQAISTGGDSVIKGVVKEHHILPDGFFGIISNFDVDACFYMGSDYIETEEEGGLVPILLKDSEETKKPIQMEGHFDKEIGIFVTENLKYKYNSIDYYI